MDKFEIGDKVNFVVERSLLSGVITKFYKNPYGEEECSIKTEIKTFPHILLQRVKKVSDEDDLISKIAELEVKLAEKDKQILELQEQSIRDNQIYNEELAEKKKEIEEKTKGDDEVSKELYEVTIDYTKDYNGESWVATISDEKYIDMNTFERTKAHLETKLAESERESNARYRAWQEEIGECDRLRVALAEKDAELENWSTQYARAYVNRQNALIAEKVELKEQLAEKEKEVEELKKFDDLNKTFFDLFRTAFKEPDKVDDLFNTLKTMQEKQDQDKISFAVERLKKVRNIINGKVKNIDKKLDELNVKIVCESTSRQLDAYEEIVKEINNQIKELKEKDSGQKN